MIQRTTWLTGTIAALLLALGSGCQAISRMDEDPEGGDLGEGFTNPAALEGQRDLDSTLCWQSIDPKSAEVDVTDAAYGECMRQKGWDPNP